MSSKSIIAMCILLALLELIVADTLPTRPGPFGSCSGIESYQCPASTGCCFAGSCCGSGCCAATETCVYPNTPQAGCCRFDDPTLCGSKAAPVPGPESSNTPSNDPIADPNCVRIRTCTNSAGHWQCLLGKSCGFFLGDCGTCPALLVSSKLPSASARSTPLIVPSSTKSSVESNLFSASSRSTPSSSESLGNSPAGSSPSVSSSGNDASRHAHVGAAWKAMVAVVPAYALMA